MLVKILPRSFYERKTEIVARDLLGKILMYGGKQGRITEVEAYLGEKDPASRKVFPGTAGIVYVFIIYGMNWCFNIITGTKGKFGCVLITGIDETFGPGRVSKFFGFTGEHNGVDVTKGSIEIAQGAKNFDIGVSPRIGITKAINLPLRFYAINKPSEVLNE